MKIRNGFVSNSSSASFCVKGFILDKKEYPGDEVLEKIIPLFIDDFPEKPTINKVRCCDHEEIDAEFCPQCGKPMWGDNDGDFVRWDRELYDWGHDLYEQFDIKVADHPGQGADPATCLVGVQVSYSHSDGYPRTTSMSDEHINNILEQIKTTLGIEEAASYISGSESA